jgi:hypothetical protein
MAPQLTFDKMILLARDDASESGDATGRRNSAAGRRQGPVVV